jgi:PAS domain S-box-containing protein
VKLNPALQQFLGYSAEEVRERHFSDFSHPEDRTEGVALYSQLRSGVRDSYQTEKRYLRKDGQVVWGRLTVSLLQGSEKSAGFAIGLVEDFTDRRLLQAEMQQAGKMEAVGRLAGGIAHDFNNILNVILGCGELALAELQNAPETRRLVEEILTSADRAALLTRQLLTFSRKQTLETRVLDPGVVVQEMAQLLRRVLGEDVEIVVSCPPGVARIRADRGQLEQVLMNLAVNSRDAMLAGGRLEIETVAMELDDAFVALHPGSRPGPHVRLSVADNGSGMTREVLARVFEPFFTTKGGEQGHQARLATVYGIVKRATAITVERAEAAPASTSAAAGGRTSRPPLQRRRRSSAATNRSWWSGRTQPESSSRPCSRRWATTCRSRRAPQPPSRCAPWIRRPSPSICCSPTSSCRR